MTTDRELLEAAVKAAGLNVKAERVDADDRFLGLIVGPKHTKLKVDWNPLTDDGDALRLAVKLGIDVSHNTFGNVIADHYTLPQKQAVVLAHGIDPCAATRRAIVALAAKLPALRVVGAV